MAAEQQARPRLSTGLVVRFQHSHPVAASTFANVGIKGPLAQYDSSGALDLTFALRVCGKHGSERQIRSTSNHGALVARLAGDTAIDHQLDADDIFRLGGGEKQRGV